MVAFRSLPAPLRWGLVLLACAFLPPVLNAAGILTDYWALTLGKAVCIGVAGLSLNLLMGYAGQISLGQFALLGVGAFASGIITGADRLALPFGVAIPVSAAAGATAALLIGVPALRLRGVYLAVATIGFAFAMQQSLFNAEWVSKGSAGVELPRPLVGSYEFSEDAHYLALLLVMLVGVWFVDSNITGTKLGRAFQAIRADEPMASSFGIDVPRYKLLAFVLSGAVAGIAGGMWGHLFRFVNAESFDFQRSLLLVIVVVVGGLGSRVGVLVAAGFYTVLPEVLIDTFGEGFRGTDLIVGAALLMYTVSRHPGGLAEAWHEGRDRRAAKLAAAATSSTGDDADTPSIPKLPQLPRPSGLPDRPELAAGEPVLQATGVTVRFGGLVAVDDASITVARNRIAGLIGPNGAGKTTFFNAISGLVQPDAGDITLLGTDVTHLPPHARARLGMGRTFQLIGLAKDLSVTENLLLAQHVVAGYAVPEALASVGRAPRIERELRQRAADTVEALDFGQYSDTPVKRLSHGQQRIVEIGCALVTAPELVMLDEPSAGMSPGAVENLAVRLRDIRDDLGRTVLLIEHNIPLVLDVCDDLTVLSTGQVLASGAPDEVVGRQDVITAYLGEPVGAGR